MEAISIVLLASAALLVRAGQMLGAMGIARAKNVASAGLRNLADLCVATLCFWALGAAICFQQSNGVFRVDATQLIGWSGVSGSWFTTLAAVLVATGIIAPALSERSRLRVPLTLGGVLAALLVPMVLHWTHRGWLANLGMIDAGGAAAIHLVPALVALVGIIFVGPRDGKYNRDGSSNMIPGHSVPMILFSAMLMLIGWTPYIGAAAFPIPVTSYAGANVLVAAAAAGLASLVFGHIRFGKADVLLTLGGVLGGLVSITAAAASVGTPAAFLIGAVAGMLIPYLTVIIDLRWKIDDPGGVIAIHGVGGIWALISTAIFAPIPLADHFKLLGVTLMGIAVIAITTITIAMVALIVLRSFGSLRSKEADEYDGLDLAEHDINAHPDFQQTMIKSYHLREA
jgi:Amt family ammonium transporter